MVVIGIPSVFDASVRISTDLASVAWLAAAVALALRAARPEGPTNAVAFAMVAFGLAVGTKTTVGLVGFAWTVSPYTGVDADGAGAIFAFSTIRYLMGVTVLAVVALPLWQEWRGYLSRLALGTLLVSSLWAALELYPGGDAIPTPGALALGAAFGLAIGVGLELCRRALGQRAALLCAGILALVGLLGFSTYPARFLDSYSEHEPIASAAQDSPAVFGCGRMAKTRARPTPKAAIPSSSTRRRSAR